MRKCRIDKSADLDYWKVGEAVWYIIGKGGNVWHAASGIKM